MAVCLAVIAKDNFPLFVRSVPAEDELKFTYIVHTSLDVVEERLNAAIRNSGEMRELYLGLLYPTEDYRVYGFVTNTRVKFIIIIEASNVNLRDNDVRGMFRKLHGAYVNVVFNPFYSTGDTIVSNVVPSRSTVRFTVGGVLTHIVFYNRSFDSTVSGILIED